MSRTIASRASWGARYQNGVGSRPAKGLQKYLHHSVTRHLPATATVAQERVECRVVERIGQQRFNAGISYTILIFPSGRIYWGAGIDRISYHSGGGRDGKPRNTLGVGICLVGNTHANDMTSEQEDALVWLLQEGVRRGWWNDPAITEGHRDFKATSCPGDYAYRRIDRINRRARGGSYADYLRNGLPDDDSDPANPPTTGRTWLDMATPQEVAAAVWGYINEALEDREAYTILRHAARDRGPEVWGYKGRNETSDAYAYLRATRREVAAAAGERAGLLEAIRQISGGEPVDLDAITTAAQQGVTEAIASLEADVTLNINTTQQED